MREIGSFIILNTFVAFVVKIVISTAVLIKNLRASPNYSFISFLFPLIKFVPLILKKDDNDHSLEQNVRNCILYRKGEKQILHFMISCA